jgi:hypothetical protein
MKAPSFGPYIDPPEKAGCSMELAIGYDAANQDRLSSSGWLITDPLHVSRDPWVYHSFIQNSKAEFSVAKHGCVVSHSGWFSESAYYLASARPVVTQETGFTEHQLGKRRPGPEPHQIIALIQLERK